MATLNIQGQKVKVDDAFLSMTPEQQNAAVEEIAKSLPAAAPATPATGLSDAAKAGIERAKANASLSPEAKRASAGIDPTTGQPAGVPAYAPMDMGAGGTSLTSTMEGVPILGPALDKAQTASAAGLGSLISGEPYSQVHGQMQEMVDGSRAAHPHARTAGNVAGAVAGTVPAMLAAPEVFGVGLATAPGILASGASGSLINAADSAVRSGGDPNEIRKGGLIGLGGGLAGSMLGPVIGKGVKAVVDNVKIGAVARALGLDKSATKVLADAVRQDAVDPAALSKLGDDAMMMDLGPNLRHTAGAIAATPGEGKAIVRGAIGARDADANWRIRSALNDTLGEAPTPSRIIVRADQNQTRLQPEYREALRDAGPVDTLPIARYLDRDAQTLRGDAQRSIQQIRRMLDYVPTPEEITRARVNGQPVPGGLVTDAETLLNTRHAIDGKIKTEANPDALNALQTARQAVDDELAATVPGIKEVDAKYSELARQKEAVQRGQTVLSSGREAPRPDELADEVRHGALPQGLQIGPSAVPLRLREGARAEIERIVGTKANDRVALQEIIKGEGDWNRARLSTLWGKEKTEKVLDLLDRERLFADTSNIVTRNSETAARAAAREAITGQPAGFGVREGFIAGGARGAVRAAGIRTGEKVIEALRNGGNDKAIADMARTLTGGQQQSAVLDALMNAGRGSKVQPKQVESIARALLLSGGSQIPR
ncbi:hypothetical protein [Mesorhizobium ciceri]|uniref:hypothetical protein n=1 Tax=Mesorhizobium TaxID=68287 RepID=UPI0004ADE35F|nr:hypothetical protein [Mesorhizobium ciceri]